MRSVILIAIVASHLLIVAKRLPEWNSNKSIWVAAVKTNPLDPWCLNNAAHFTHDKRAAEWLVKFASLDIPNWLPYSEREPYRVGLKSLADSLKSSGFEAESDKVNNKSNEVTIGHKIVVGYVTQ